MAEPRRRFRSLRGRTTILATVVVGLALAVGALVFYGALSASLDASALATAQSRVEGIAARLEGDGPGPRQRPGDVLEGIGDDEIAQVIDGRTGAVIATTDEAEGVRLPVSDDPVITRVDGERVLVVSEDERDTRVVAGVSLQSNDETLRTVGLLLLAAVPLLTVVVGLTTWLVVGRALRPVERIRAEVAAIRGDRLDRRVPVPDSGDEIAALAGTMNGMLDRLDAAARAQRRFVSDASHELRSPLATIRQHAETAAAHPEAVDTAELAAVVRDEGLRLQDLVESLLLLARLDEGAPLRREEVDLDDLALAEAARLRAGGADVDTAGVGPARVHGDPRLFGQVTRNLADNAARHARSRIAIGVVEHAGAAVLTVEDDGDGIPESERERVFDRFVRLDEARARDAGGSGLGLAIVRGIVVAAGGSIHVDASRWGGARFTVVLPTS
ncbi:HAMP domain-containing sensor histidine kinase [Microbacterium sp. 10M-3C3]|uniref:sensor histidine kinase n=1 Tax=Microbacterium sp. 10M-3C3 TaxID=2483401 RepID=UPI0013DE3A52|nr:HAMP domain-containing sensor histidine kinase [Microbacterium sp. 10M-3C3]